MAIHPNYIMPGTAPLVWDDRAGYYSYKCVPAGRKQSDLVRLYADGINEKDNRCYLLIPYNKVLMYPRTSIYEVDPIIRKFETGELGDITLEQLITILNI